MIIFIKYLFFTVDSVIVMVTCHPFYELLNSEMVHITTLDHASWKNTELVSLFFYLIAWLQPDEISNIKPSWLDRFGNSNFNYDNVQDGVQLAC